MAGAVVDPCAALIAASGASAALAARLDAALVPWRARCRAGAGAGAGVGRSLLTPTGAPLELTLRSGGPGGAGQVAFTVEPGLPDAPVAEKWRRLCGLAPDVGEGRWPLADALRGAEGQRFGCWLGLREGGAKYYQEVAPAAREGALVAMAAAMAADCGDAVLAAGLVPLLAGFAGSGAGEYYAHWPRADAAAVHRLLAALGHAAALPAVVDAMGWLSGRSADQGWASLRSGVSLVRAEDAGVTVSLYWHGRSLFGSPALSAPALAYRRLTDVAAHMGGLGLLEPLCASVDARGQGLCCGMVGVVLRSGHAPGLTVGIAPEVSNGPVVA